MQDSDLLGVAADGWAGTAGPGGDRIFELLSLVLWVVSAERVTLRMLQVVVGPACHPARLQKHKAAARPWAAVHPDGP